MRPTAPDTPDFDVYPILRTIREAAIEQGGRVMRATWSDDMVSRYHAIWLRDNATDAENLNPQTREQWTDVTDISPDVAIASLSVDGEGFITVGWTTSDVTSRFHPGWLAAHDYSNAVDEGEAYHRTLWQRILWDAVEQPEPPTINGADVLTDDTALEAWLTDVAVYGIGRLRSVEPSPGMVAKVAERIGPVRTTNFGQIFDVKVQTGPGSNAYSSVALTPHSDLATREYQPGLQLLHCLRTTDNGGYAIMVDGFKLAEVLSQRDPAAYRILTDVVWPTSNRAEVSDYRWPSPVIRTDGAGDVIEIRAVPFLRAPLNIAFDQVEEAYRSLRLFFEMTKSAEFQMRFPYRPGDLICMDNRRLLHGREAYEPGTNERWLQGCYSEREELLSRLRMLARQRRA